MRNEVFQPVPQKLPTFNELRTGGLEGVGAYGDHWARMRAQELGITIPQDLMAEFDLSLRYDLIPDHAPVQVRNGKLKPAGEYWGQVGIKEDVINQIVDTEGKWIFQVPDEKVKDLFQMDPLAAAEGMIDAMAVLYDNNRYPLHDSVIREKEGKQFGLDGMNEHGQQHVKWVTRNTYAFLKMAQPFRKDITERTFRVGTTAAAGHDVGQILLRNGQEIGSVAVLEHAMSGLKGQVDGFFFEDVKRAIVIHPEANVTDLAERVWHTAGNAAATIQKMYEELRPEELALILADKLHIGQDRLPSKWRDSDGILRDLHVGVNAAFDVDAAGYTPNGNTFKVEMAYNPGLEESYFAKVNGLSSLTEHPAVTTSKHHRNGRFKMPNAIHQLLRAGKASHSEVLEALMWSEHGYHARLRLAIMAAFALNPATENVEIEISDPDATRGLSEYLPNERIAEIQSRKYTFTRDSLDEELVAIQHSFAEKGIDVDALKKAGQELLPPASPTRRALKTA